jgi:hypothetical protein
MERRAMQAMIDENAVMRFTLIAANPAQKLETLQQFSLSVTSSFSTCVDADQAIGRAAAR